MSETSVTDGKSCTSFLILLLDIFLFSEQNPFDSMYEFTVSEFKIPAKNGFLLSFFSVAVLISFLEDEFSVLFLGNSSFLKLTLNCFL